MFSLPSDTLSYINIDHSVVCSVLAGLFMLPLPLLIIAILFWCWQEDLWEDQEECMTLLEQAGFVLSERSFWPRWQWKRDTETIRIYHTPLFSWASLHTKSAKKRRVPLEKTLLVAFIDSLDPQGAISTLQKY